MKGSTHLSSERGTPNARTPPNLFPMRKSNRTFDRNKFKFKQYIPPLLKSQYRNTMVPRSRGGGRSTKCDPDGRTTNPYRPRAPPLLNEAIAEYLALSVLRRMNKPETQSTRHWALVFGRRKSDSGKIRMITDLRQLNSAWAQPPKFKTDNRQTVGDCLSFNTHLTWGAMVDLSNSFFHLGLHPSAGRWIRIKTEMGDFQ